MPGLATLSLRRLCVSRSRQDRNRSYSSYRSYYCHYEKRRNLDSALAGTFRIFVCSDLSRARETNSEVPSDWCRCFDAWTCNSCVGGRAHSKEFPVGCFGAVCLHKESSLPGKLHSRPWVHDS